MSAITFALLLIAGHYVADFAMQNQFVADMKGKVGVDPHGIHALTAHAMHHATVAGIAAFAVGAPWIAVALAVGVTHWLIDYAKADRNMFGVHVDQALHIAVLLTVAVVWS